MRTWAIYLWPRGPSRPIYSDTLFGAMCWAWRAVHGAPSLRQFLAGAAETPPFVTSSAFPAIRTGQGVLRTFPAPLVMRPEVSPRTGAGDRAAGRQQIREECREGQAAREFATVPHVSEGILQDVAAGAQIEDLRQRLASPTDREKMVTAGVLARPEEWGTIPEDIRGRPLWREADVLRNQTDRVAGATAGGMLFSVPGRFYARGVGLWFALRADTLDPFVPCLRYLADTGIGGKRSVGWGHFAIPIPEIHEITLPKAQAPGRFVVLSRYSPEPGEIVAEHPHSSYRMVPWFPKHEARGAAPAMPVFKGRMWVMAEGSVLVPRNLGREVYGRCTRTADQSGSPGTYSVFQNGATIPVFLPVENEHV